VVRSPRPAASSSMKWSTSGTPTAPWWAGIWPPAPTAARPRR
jgi:hypothetical protein